MRASAGGPAPWLGRASSMMTGSVADSPDPSATLTEPGDVDTRDVLGARARADRDKLIRRLPASTTLADSAIVVGRYRVLDVVGQGGMGLVLAAWDPELERRVAIKLIRLSSTASRERMLREGQLLARLSHPNIVPVFDVGSVDDQVYLVMEFVRGATLRGFAASAPGRDGILDAYRQAGAGLLAGHEAGVIHRDFKPDNAIRGDDGRVRVLDFGIAHTRGSLDMHAAAGTPRYMAPEQASRAELTPAVDQFAFSVALREALEANGGVPAWLATILDRAGAPLPQDRFPSFADLLAALAWDPARRRRRVLLGAGVAIAASGAFTVGLLANDTKGVEPCSGGASEIAATWNPGVRGLVTSNLARLAAGGRTDTVHLPEALDRYARTWVGVHRSTCLAHERGEVTTNVYAARLGCMDRTRAQLAAVAALLGRVDADGYDNAVFAESQMPDVHGCEYVSSSVTPPPALLGPAVTAIGSEVERAVVLANAWRPESVEIADRALHRARMTSYAPLVARALLAQGRARLAQYRADADVALDEAARTALEVDDDPLAVEAYARWVFARARGGQSSTENASAFGALGRRLGPQGRFQRALLLNSQGVARMIANDVPGARTLFGQAQAEAQDAPELELALIDQNLANLDPTPVGAVHLIDKVYARYRAALGPDNAQTLSMQLTAALMSPDAPRARAALAACSGAVSLVRLECAYEGGWILDAMGDVEGARRLMAQVPEDTPELGVIARAYLEVRAGASNPATTRALAKLAAEPHEALYEHITLADLFVVIALSSSGPAADAAWERAWATIEPVVLASARGRRARIAAEVAQRLASSEPRRAASLAAVALAWYGLARGENAALVARLEEIRGPSSP